MFFTLTQLIALEYPAHVQRACKEGFTALSQEQFKRISIRAMCHAPS